MPKKQAAMEAEELSEARGTIEFTQSDLSIMLGFSPQTVSTWEGKTKQKIVKWKKLYSLMAIKAYKDGYLTKDGELSQEFIDSAMRLV